MRNLLLFIFLFAYSVSANAQLWKTADDIFRTGGGRGLSKYNYKDTDSVAVNITLPQTATTAASALSLGQSNATKVVSLSTNQATQQSQIDAKATITKGNNLFSLSGSNLFGVYVDNATGGTPTNAIYNVTHYITATASQTITPSYKHNIAYYDANYNYVPVSTSLTSQSRSNATIVVPTTTPAIAYVRFTVLATAWKTFQVNLGTLGSFDLGGTRLSNDLKTNPAPYSISELQTTFLTKSRNLFDKNAADTLQNGYLLATTNQFIASINHNTTGFIPVVPGTQYVANYVNQVTFYDSLKQYVSGLSGRPYNYFTTPSNVYYARFTVQKWWWDKFQVEVGTTTSLPVPAGPVLQDGTQFGTTTMDYARPTNQVAIAQKFWIPSGNELAIYSENIQKNYAHYKDKIEVTINSGSAFTTDRGVRLKTSTPGSYTGTVTVADNQYNTISTIPFSISVVSLTATTSWKQLNIGDSYTYRSTFANSFSATSNVTFLGTRISSASSASVLCEGRGGFTIAQYTTHSTTLYMPFMQPTATYLYLGNTSFWIAANAGLSDAVGQGYDYNRFVNANQFNATTGYPTSPRVNDLIYDNSLSQYKAWNGTSWGTVGTPTFAFSFAKYRQCWNIAQPDGVQILLGTNDNANANETTFPAAYTTFKAALDVMISSIQADSPNARIAIGIPNSSARMGETETLTTGRRKGAYWNHANRVITDYSGKESQRIYVLDYHSIVDRVYGYTRTLSKPFDAYSGTETVPIVSDFTHIDNGGFTQMGDQLLGWIQSFR